MTNFTLIAVTLFIFMGVTLERSGLAAGLWETMELVFGRLPGGLAIPPWAVFASVTGIVFILGFFVAPYSVTS